MKEENNKKDLEIDPDFDSQDNESGLDIEAEETPESTIKSLKQKLKQVLAEKNEYLTGWQRAKADFVNARKRDESERAEFIKFANESLILDLLPVMGSFEMAMANKEVWEKVDKNWRVGVEYIAQSLKKVLEDRGLREVNPLGEDFDPARHESVSNEPVKDKSLDHKILAVKQKGYLLNDKLLAVPKVIVGEYKDN